MSEIEKLIRNYRKAINPPYSSKDFPIIAGTFLILLLATAFVLNFPNRFKSKETEPTKAQEKSEISGPQFLSNELLIKVKRASRGKVHDGNTADTGIAALNALNRGKNVRAKFDYKIKGFEKVVKQGKNSKTDEDLFSWYKVTLDGPSTLIEGKLNQAKEIILNSPANSDNKPRLNSGQAVVVLQEIIENLAKDPDIEAIDLNYEVEAFTVPNDPYYLSSGSWGQSYPDLWGIKKINPEPAWDQSTGSATIVVAGIDTGVDRNHPDIAVNMWVNSAEIPGNSIDDDGNGYVDDYYGWDWVNKDPDPMDDHGHGTHTAGTIAAVGNNGVGVVGVNWTSKIMALKFLDNSGSGYLDNGIKALQYAADMGARVSSNSWGCGCPSRAMDDAVKYEHDRGMVMVAAAGNSKADAIGFSPADADYAVTVAASDSNDAKASFSNWGEKIDVAAPGVDILSIRASNNPMCDASRTVGTNYCRVSGTSMATPHVAGLVALLWSKNPSLINEEVRQIIRTGSDDLGTPGKDANYGFGRINANGSMGLADTNPLTPIITSPSSRTLVTSSSIDVTGSVGGPNFASYKLEYGFGRSPSSWTNLSTSTTQPTSNTIIATLNTATLAEGIYAIRLTGTDTSGKTYQFQIFDLTVDNFDAAISFPQSLIPISSVDVIGTAITKNGTTFANYKLEWSQNNNTWLTTGITLTNGGNTAITNGKLGTWDTSTLVDGQTYYLRLTVNSTSGLNLQTTMTTRADKDLVSGWPKTISSSNASSYTSPVLADLNSDGKKDIIVGGGDGKLYAFQKDGSQLPGFPVSFLDALYFAVGPNLADLDNDGRPEILAQVVTTSYTYKLYILKNDGSLYPGWPTTTIVGAGTPTVADLDGDGIKDIVTMKVTTWIYETDFDLHAYHLNGMELVGFPKRLVQPPVGFSAGQIFPISSRGPLTIADLDHDGAVEIGFIFSDRFYLFDNQGNVLPGWPFIVPPSNNYIYVFDGLSLSSGDLDGDGNLELFAQNNYACSYIGGNLGGCSGGNAESVLYALRKDGTVLSGWPKTTVSDGFYATEPYPAGGWSPAVADMDGDGKDDVVTSDYRSGIRIFTYAGKKVIPNVGAGYTSSAIADVDGDGHLEVANGYYGSVGIYKDNGTAYLNKNVGGFINGSLALADIDNNGKEEMIAINAPYGSTVGVQGIYLWEIPTTGTAKYEWPMFGHDPARSGRLLLGSIPTPIPTVPTTPTNTPVPTSTPIPPTSTPTPVPVDTTAPIVTITNPLAGSTVAVRSTLSIAATASDNIGVARVDFLVNGTLKCSDAASPYSCSWKVPAAKNKAYTIAARAYDAAGNNSTSSISVTAK